MGDQNKECKWAVAALAILFFAALVWVVFHDLSILSHIGFDRGYDPANVPPLWIPG